MLLSKVKKENVNKAKPPPFFSCYCRNLESKRTRGGGGLKPVGGGDCEKRGPKVLRFLSQLRPRIYPLVFFCILFFWPTQICIILFYFLLRTHRLASESDIDGFYLGVETGRFVIDKVETEWAENIWMQWAVAKFIVPDWRI